MPSRSPLEQLHRLDRSSLEFHDQVSNVLYGEEYKQWVPTIEGDDLVGLVGYLDEVLDNLDPASPAFQKCLHELKDICGTKMILPPSYTLSSQDLTVGQAIAPNGSSDLHEGKLNGSSVCIKRIKTHSEKLTKITYQVAVVWKHLKHQNIVPLLGITPDPLRLISEWMPGGGLTEYIERCPSADRLVLLSDVTEGLHFLHSCNIVHGDLKGQNILVDDTDHARITDFGLAIVAQNEGPTRSASGGRDNSVDWTAPEILSREGMHSKEADIFSFAMVMVEIFTGAAPFGGNKLALTIAMAIMDNKRPPKPEHEQFTDQLWTLMQRCWDQDPLSRPGISEVLKILRGGEKDNGRNDKGGNNDGGNNNGGNDDGRNDDGGNDDGGNDDGGNDDGGNDDGGNDDGRNSNGAANNGRNGREKNTRRVLLEEILLLLLLTSGYFPET